MFKKALSLLLALMLIVTSVSITAISVSAADDEPTTEAVVYPVTVAGSNADIFGTAWAKGLAENAMTQNGDGTYTKVYEKVGPAENVSLKVVDGDNWIGNLAGDNVTFNLTKEADLTVKYDPKATDTSKVTVSAEGIEFHEFKASLVEKMVAVGGGAGSNFLNGENWNEKSDANAMEKKSEGVYEIVFDEVEAKGDYQFKFAANNGWTDNFGNPTTDFAKMGENTAKYNGENIYFEVPEDGSTVTLTLDMSKFDLVAGVYDATYTITVEGPDGTVVTNPVVEPTTEEKTEAVVETTEKATEAPAPADGKLKVNAVSNIMPTVSKTFDAATDTITCTWWIQSPKQKMVNVQGIITYDDKVLTTNQEMNQTYDEEEDEYNDAILRITGGVATVTNYTPNLENLPKDGNNNGIRFNASQLKGYNMYKGKDGNKVPFVSVTFKKADGATGETNVHLYIEILSYKDGDNNPYLIKDMEIVDSEFQYIPDSVSDAVYAGPFDESYEPVEEPTTEEPTTEEPTTEEPTTEEPTTEEPTTEAPTTEEPTTEEPTTEAPTTEPAPVGKFLTVNSTSNFYSEKSITYTNDIPAQVIVEYYCATDKYKIINGQYILTYDPAVLKFNEASNTDDEDNPTVCPVAKNVQANFTAGDGVAKFNFSDPNGDRLVKKDGTPTPVVRLVFDVVGEGETNVNLDVYKQTFKDFDAETDPDTWYMFYNGSEDAGASVLNKLKGDDAQIYTVFFPEAPEPIPTTEEPTTEEPTTAEPTTEEPTTAEPTTEEPTTAEPTTEEPTTVNTKLNVTAVAKVDENAGTVDGFSVDAAALTVEKGETVKLVYRVNTGDKAIESLQWIANYDPAFLTLVSAEMPKVTEGAAYNTTVTGTVKANASNIINRYEVAPTDDFIVLTFTAAEAGETEVTVTLTDILLDNGYRPEPTTEEPTTVEPTTEEPTTVEPTTAEPTTVEPTTVEPTTVEPTTAEPTTAEPTTVEPTTAEPTTAEPTTAEPTTEAPTTPVGDHYSFVLAPSTWTHGKDTDAVFTIKDNVGGADVSTLFSGLSVDGTKLGADAFEAKMNDDGTLTVTVKAAYLNGLTIADHNFKFMFNDESLDTVVKIVEDATSASETVAPTTSKATSDTATKDSAKTSTNGTVKTGSASMAMIILLVLVSGTAAIFFARRRTNKK